MAITAQMRTEVSQLYVALFGRAPDGDGLGFWVSLRDQGQSLAQIANTMYATTPARAYFPSFLTNSEIINSFYVNVLGRSPDADGLAFWTGKLNAAGATPGSVISEMINVVANYTGTDAAGKDSQALFNNRVSVAQFYGESNGTIAGATAALTGVTKDPATVTTAKANITNGTVVGVNQGLNLVLTTGVDSVTGTNGNDTITADNTGATKQLSVADTINGGLGTDTLKIYLAAADTATGQPTLSGIENVYINGGAVTAYTAAAGTTGLTIDAAVQPAATTYTLSGQTLTLQNLKPGQATTTSVASTADTSANIVLNNVVTGTTATWLQTIDLTGTKMTTANLTATGAASVITLANTGAALTTVNVSGDKNLSLTESINGLKTINASTATGNVSVNATGATLDAAFAFTGGSGNDTVSVAAGALALLTAGSQLDGGAGTDNLTTSETAVLTAAQVAKVNAAKNFEVLGFRVTGSGVDASTLTSINQFKVNTGNLSETFSNANSSSKFTLDNSAGNTGTVVIANKVGETTTNVTLDTGTTATAQTHNVLTLTGITNVNLTSSGAAGNIITTLNNADNSNIIVTGAADLTFTLKATNIGSKVDGSAATGKLAITGNNTAYSAGSSLGDVLIGGTAADTLKASVNSSTLTGNAGNDTFDVSAAVGAAAAAANPVVTTVTDLNKGDMIKFAASAGAFTTTKVDLSGAATLAAALDTLAAGNNSDLKWGQFGGNTYVVDDVGAGATFGATDTVVKITGLVDLSTSTFAAGTNTLTFA